MYDRSINECRWDKHNFEEVVCWIHEKLRPYVSVKCIFYVKKVKYGLKKYHMYSMYKWILFLKWNNRIRAKKISNVKYVKKLSILKEQFSIINDIKKKIICNQKKL